MDKIFKMGILTLSIACLVCIFYQPILLASELSEDKLSEDELPAYELPEEELSEDEFSALELSDEEVMCIVLLSHKYSVPEGTICRLLVEYNSSVGPESLCAYEEPESMAACYKARLEDLSKQLDISKETLGSMIFDCKMFTIMAHGFRSKLDKHFYLEVE